MRSQHRIDTICLAAIAAAAIVGFSSILAGGASRVVGPPDTDMAQQFYPLRLFVHEQVAQGILPLWNPHLFCGLPIHAEGQAGLLYPLGVLGLPLPATLGINLVSLAHWALAGIFLYLYLRAIAISPAAALLGAIVYMFSSAPVARLYAGHYSMMPFLAICPGMMWVWQRYLRQGRVRWLAAAALLYGSAILAAHPQSLFYMSLYVGWLMLWGAAARRGERRRRAIGRLTLFGLALGIGVGIGAAQLLPTLELAARSFRQETTPAFCGVFSLAPESLLTFLAPGFFGDMIATPYWGRNYLWEMWGYVGIVPLALAMAASLRPRGAAQWAHAAAVPVFILLALGRHTPLFQALYEYAPGFDKFRGLSKFLIFCIVSLSVLAAVGFDRLGRSPRSRRARGTRMAGGALLAAFVLVALIALLALSSHPGELDSPWAALIEARRALGEDYTGFFRTRPDAGPAWTQARLAMWATARGQLIRLLAFAAAGLAAVAIWPRLARKPYARWAVLALLVVPDVYLFCRPYVLSTPVDALALPKAIADPVRRAAPARVYSTTVSGSRLMTNGLDAAQGYVGLLPARTNRFFAIASGYPPDADMSTSPPPRAFSHLFLSPNIQFILTHEAETLPEDFATRVASAQGLALYRLRHSAPRARFSRAVQGADTVDRATSLLRASAAAPDAMPMGLRADILEMPPRKHGESWPALQPWAESKTPQETGALREVERRAGRVVYETNLSAPMLLATSDAYDPGWVCELDGEKRLDVYPVNVAFRGAIVPAGRHRVAFVYRLASFRWGVAVSLASLLTLAGLIALARRRASL